MGGEEGWKGKNILCQPQQPHNHVDPTHRAGTAGLQTGLTGSSFFLCEEPLSLTPTPPPQRVSTERPNSVFSCRPLWLLSISNRHSSSCILTLWKEKPLLVPPFQSHPFSFPSPLPIFPTCSPLSLFLSSLQLRQLIIDRQLITSINHYGTSFKYSNFFSSRKSCLWSFSKADKNIKHDGS